MENKIIKTDKYLLIVDDSEIKEDDWVYDVYNGIVKVEHKYQLSNILVFRKDCQKIIAHLPLNNSPILEGIPLLPPFIRHQENDIEEFSKQCNQLYKNWLVVGYKAGYNKAKEKYRFTEIELDSAIDWAIKKGREGDVTITDIDNFIQSLSQPKMPTHFEIEMVDYGHYEIGVDDFIKHGEKIKTTTNSQGQTVWVGKYIY